MGSDKTTDLARDALNEPRSARERHAALFKRITTRIHRYFLKTVWDATEAEELTQRTLLELERSLRKHSYDPARSFNAWMWLKAHTVFAQWCRERGRLPEPLPDSSKREPTVPASHEREVDERLDAAAILREVQRRLGNEIYEIFVLYYEGGLTQSEVGDVVGRDRKTVAARMRQAHAFIDSLLGRKRQP